MSIEATDIRRTLAYRTDGVFLQGVPSALWLILLGLIARMIDMGDDLKLTLAGWALIIVGIGWIGIALYRRSQPAKPLFILSPAGIYYRIPCVREFLVPWTEIQGVDTIHLTTMHRATPNPRPVMFDNVTVVLISKALYDQKIFIDSPLLRGPGWENIFIPQGEFVQFLLHHELVTADPRALRNAVESRWLAFRDQPKGNGSVPGIKSKPAKAKPVSDIATLAEDAIADRKPKQPTLLDIVKLAPPLIGIVVALAHLAGVSRLPI